MEPEQQPYSPPPITPENRPDSPFERNSSHVTSSPENMPGENYNPRIRSQYANEPGVVHTERALDIQPFTISDKVQRLHDDSVKNYPHLNLSGGEFVILDIKRHGIGMVAPVIAGAVVVLALTGALVIYPSNPEQIGVPSFNIAILIAGLVMLLVGIGTYISIWVYLKNQFYLTNESVIQKIQTSLFSRREQMVSLGSIEDASFHQSGILQTMLNYGSIRLSTEGDETTYRFSYVTRPRAQVSTVSNAIEAFKNGRPFDLDNDVKY